MISVSTFFLPSFLKSVDLDLAFHIRAFFTRSPKIKALHIRFRKSRTIDLLPTFQIYLIFAHDVIRIKTLTSSLSKKQKAFSLHSKYISFFTHEVIKGLRLSTSPTIESLIADLLVMICLKVFWINKTEQGINLSLLLQSLLK